MCPSRASSPHRVTFCSVLQIAVLMAANNQATLSGLSPAGLEAKLSFFAMNTKVTVTLADRTQSRRLQEVRDLFAAFENRFSRFRADSELGNLNRRGAGKVSVSPEMIDLLEECRHFSEATGGIFNPLILGQLEASGYTRSFEWIKDGVSRSTARRSLVPALEIELDFAGNEVMLPEGTRLDFGGIGKGYAVDRSVELLGDGGYLIDAGGDIFASGCNAQGEPWRIDVANPRQPNESLATLALVDQAVATSWTVKRRWRVGDSDGFANHLIDPRNGVPVENGVLGVTVVAGSTAAADVFAKTALILGSDAGPDFLSQQGADGLMVLEDGTLIATPKWPAQLAQV